MKTHELRTIAMQEEKRTVERLLPVYKTYLRTHGGYHADRWRMSEWFHAYVAHNAGHISISRSQIHSLLPLLDQEIDNERQAIKDASTSTES